MSLNTQILEDISELDLMKVVIDKTNDRRTLKLYSQKIANKISKLLFENKELESLYQTLKNDLGLKDTGIYIIEEIKEYIIVLNNVVLNHPKIEEISKIVEDYKMAPSERDYWHELLEIIYYRKKSTIKQESRKIEDRIDIEDIIDTILAESLLVKDLESDEEGENLEERIAQIYAGYVLDNFPNLF